MSAITNPLHAVVIAVAVDQDGPLAGALILGPSGAGKSSLALSAIEGCPFRRTALVADDAVLIAVVGARVIARAPAAISGRIEIRGFGPVSVRTVPAAELMVAFDLAGEAARLPRPREFEVMAGAPMLPLYPFVWKAAESTAPHRLRCTIAAILCGQSSRHTQDDALNLGQMPE